MTDFDREERAFREALGLHSADAPTALPPVSARSRRPWWLVSVGAAAAVVLAVLVAPSLTRNLFGEPTTPPATTTSIPGGEAWSWISYRNVEVQAPRGWDYDRDAVRPDCIDPNDPTGFWTEDVPRAPYVTLDQERAIWAVECTRDRRSGDPGPAFGALPFPLWQPYIKLGPVLRGFGLADGQPADGQWEYRDWHLTRRTIGMVQITVLAPPENPSLGDRVLASARTVDVTGVGCVTRSPFEGFEVDRFVRPGGEPIPTSDQVSAVAICEYSRRPESDGLEGSRRLSGDEARRLVDAIRAAPESGSGPERLPGTCTTSEFRERAIVLRFFGQEQETTSPISEAYVYYDSCFGSGIADSAVSRQLTRANCRPLFTHLPVILESASSAAVIESCQQR